MAQATSTKERPAAQPVRKPLGRGVAWPVAFYRSAVGKKWVMAVTGLMLLGFVLVHMIGNLKLYLSRQDINLYGEALRDLGGHLVPHTSLLWLLRGGIVVALVLHLHSAVTLTRLNSRARPDKYQAPRDYIAANFASRTMRYSGVLIAFYLLFHLADLTWGNANPDFVRGDPYNNLVYSFQRVPVAILYAVANVALGVHLLHGVWSVFQSLGINNPRFNRARRLLAQGVVAVIVVGNVSFPIAVQAGIVDLECPHTDPVAPCEAAAASAR
ncbi:MAG: succinate dehydrogenase cytochrome b subunit [Acidimicrobiia bacterium]|nr:succinate dehydrogenase cytochrome b subunit [Acidimicrobiia bacterium]